MNIDMTGVQFGPQALSESRPVFIHFSAGLSLQNSRWTVVVALDGRLRAQLERRKGMFRPGTMSISVCIYTHYEI